MDPERINMDDEFNNSARLRPEEVSFLRKDLLRKSPSDLTEEQIEYLSAASLENDLTAEQRQELDENLRGNSRNREVFNAIQKTRLAAPSVTYKNKSSLKKLTAGQKAFRIAASGLSIAAAIAILVVSYIFIPDRLSEENDQIASGTIKEDTPSRMFIEKPDPIIISSSSPAEGKRISAPVIAKAALVAEIPDSFQVAPERPVEYHSMPLAFIPSGPELLNQAHKLLPSDNRYSPPATEYYEERGHLRRLIASTFREKVLKGEYYSDDRIKPIEVAMASVGGLNKLLDWKMELRETLDENGSVKSVYFSSGLLTFNSPVRKTNE